MNVQRARELLRICNSIKSSRPKSRGFYILDPQERSGETASQGGMGTKTARRSKFDLDLQKLLARAMRTFSKSNSYRSRD